MREFNLLHQLTGEQTVQIYTLISSPQQYEQHLGKMLITVNGEVKHNLLDAEFSNNVMAVIKNNTLDKPSIFKVIYHDEMFEVFYDVLADSFQAVILGGGHISQVLTKILAILDFNITVVDERPEFANSERFPSANQMICGEFVNVLPSIKYNKKTAVIIITRGHQFDLHCLREVINTDAGYIGMIGSKKKVAGVIEQLYAEGINVELLRKVHAPIGLDIGAQTPAEIAISIAAEVLAVFHCGGCLPLSLRDSKRGWEW